MIEFSHTTTRDPDRQTYSSHMHNSYELFYFLQGDVDYVIEGATYRLHRHDLLLIRPRTYHNPILLSSTPYERFVINFTEEDVPTLLLPFLSTAKNVYNIREQAHLCSLFDAWTDADADFSKEELSLLVRSITRSLLLFLKHSEKNDSIQPIRRNRTLETILKYVDEHPNEPHSASTLAARHFVSTSWIVHSFQKHLGISLRQYVTRKRTLYAQQLLREGLPATEVAQACGFDSYTTFYRQYKQVFGISPQKDAKA